MIKKFISRLLGKGAANAAAVAANAAPALAGAAGVAPAAPPALLPLASLPAGKRVEVPVSAHGIEPSGQRSAAAAG